MRNANEVIYCSDWEEIFGSLEAMTPEHKLLTHTLYNAVKEAFHLERHIRRDALHWFFARPEETEGDDYFTSFNNICEELSLSSTTKKKIQWFVSQKIHQRVFFRLVEGT